MPIDALGSVNAASTLNASAATSLALPDFIKILVSQLSNQDPLKPMDNQEFMTQLAQFTSLEQSRQLNQNLEALLKVQSTSQSVGLIGRNVDISTEAGAVSGQVTQLDFSAAEPRIAVLLSTGQLLSSVRVSQILTVR